MEILDFLVKTTTALPTDTTICTDQTIKAILSLTKLVLNVIRILVPIALIVLGSIDIGKAVIAGDEKKIKEAQKPFVKRVVAAILVFLIPWIVDIIMGILGSNQYSVCWGKVSGTLTEFQNLIK